MNLHFGVDFSLIFSNFAELDSQTVSAFCYEGRHLLYRDRLICKV